MDPIQALNDADQAVSDGDFQCAVESLNAYYQWRLKGGYQPFVTPVEKHGDQFADQIATRLVDAMEHAIEVTEVPHIEGKDVA